MVVSGRTYASCLAALSGLGWADAVLLLQHQHYADYNAERRQLVLIRKRPEGATLFF
jgi:hypothetical protein